MAEGKWITGIAPETPAHAAAAEVLATRLEVVARNLPLAADKSHEDPEHVHQLRVATRRAGAALRIFGRMLPRADRTRARSLLGGIRRAAGAARDWDVFLHALARTESLRPPETQAAGVFLTGYALAYRTAAQEALVAAIAVQRDGLDKLVPSLPDSVRKAKSSDPQTFAGLASDRLGVLFDEFGSEIAVGPSTPHGLHQLRITAKRVRYAMEVFSECLGPAFRDQLYPAVEQVQEILGVVQDGYVGIERVEAARASLTVNRPEIAEMVKPGIDALEAELRERSHSSEDAFRAWMREWETLVTRFPLHDLIAAPGEPLTT